MKSFARSIIMVTMLIATLCSTAMADVLAPGSKVWTKFVPKYVVGNGAIVHNKAVNQTEAFLQSTTGFYLDAFDSKSLSGAEYGNETGITGAFTGIVNEEHRIGVDVGVNYIDLAPVFTGGRKDLVKTFLEVSKGFDYGLTAYAKLEVYVPMGSGDIKTREYVGAKHLWQPLDNVQVFQNAQLVWENVSIPGASCVIAQHSANVAWFVTKQISLDVMNNIYVPLAGKGKEVNVVPGIGATYRFAGI